MSPTHFIASSYRFRDLADLPKNESWIAPEIGYWNENMITVFVAGLYQEELRVGRRANRGKSAGDIRCLCKFLYNKCITRTRLTGSGSIYINRNGAIRWQISTSIEVVLEHFSLTFTIFKIFTFQISWPGKRRWKSWFTIFAVTPASQNRPSVDHCAHCKFIY